jgi:urease accessory protein
LDSTAGAVRTVVGRLDLVFAPARAGTVLAHAHVQAPLKIVRPFELDDGRVLVQILHLGPGLCAGDEYAIAIRVERGARAVVIMQSASRVLGMPEGISASQHVHLMVQSGAHFEYYPGLTIPFADSSFIQRVHVDAALDARVGILETWGTGRSLRGEHLAFRRISSRTTMTIDGDIIYADATELEPAMNDVSGAGVLEGHRYMASGFWHNAILATDAALTTRNGVLSAFEQSTPQSVYLRALAMDGSAMAQTTSDAVGLVNAAWALPPIPLRRFTA